MRKQRGADWKAPIHPASRESFERQLGWLQGAASLILDSGCGTAHSTLTWAARFPASFVLGVDQSHHRLAKAPNLPTNVRIIRARVQDIWRLLLEHQIQVDRHYLMYPNPWPKKGHLKRRWHAHPGFPSLIRLGGALELRTNWKIYADEFQHALHYYGFSTSAVVPFRPETAQSLFEHKYLESGHQLYRLTARNH
ncbi:MAG: SAM-dependent methyltransferase [Pseudomonadota bacterium]